MKQSPYARLKRGYHAVVPQRARSALYERMPDRMLRLRQRMLVRLESGARHDEIYDSTYYTGLVEPVMEGSVREIVASITEYWNPSVVIDVGCGTGRLLDELRSRDVRGFGLELSEAALEICRERGLDVRRFDLEVDDPDPTWRADVVVSTEVAEHLPEAVADRFVDLLGAVSDRIVLTAAQPGTGAGTDHVNEQPHEYWIEKLDSRGFAYLGAQSDAWRTRWSDADVEGCFVDGLMLFERRDGRR